MSDSFSKRFAGAGEGLAVAMGVACLFYVWAAYHYWRASQHIETDLDRPIGVET